MKKIIRFLMCFLTSLAFVVPSLAFASDAKLYKEISAEELVQMQKDVPNLVVIDAREGKYYDNTLIKGAIHLGTSQTNAESLAKVAAAKDTPIVFYCSDIKCPVSAMSAKQASEAGYTNLYKYPGGIAEWKEKKLPTVKSDK